MIHQLRISLNGTEPEIWRSFKINSNSTFEELHIAIQVVMGWDNSHLYEFKNKDFIIGKEYDDDYVNEKLIPSDSIAIEDVLLRKKSNIIYTYDFGDSWHHEVVVENIINDEVLLYPVCLKGEINCPPEDCGGIWGYYNLLDIIKDKKHPEYRDWIDWVGKDYDPDQFDPEAVNRVLSQMKISRKKKK